MKLLVIADDFTGAVDTGAQFKAKDVLIRVGEEEALLPGTDRQTQVLILDAETRHMGAEEAYRTIYRIVSRAVELGIPYIYKKTDSGLRGNIGSELSAMLSASGQPRLHFIPAFPLLKRTTSGGVHYIDGCPVAESVFGRDPFEPVLHSDVRAIIAEQSNTPATAMEHGVERELPEGILIYDASTGRTLEEIAQALKARGELKLVAGCAGFASVLPGVLGLIPGSSQMPPLHRRFLTICGSINPITLQQLDTAEKQGALRLQLTPEQKLNPGWLHSSDGEQAVDLWFRQIQKTDFAVIEGNQTGEGDATKQYAQAHGMDLETIRRQISMTLGGILEQLLRLGLEATILVTGGDTLLAFMEHIGQSALIPIGELAPGVVLFQIEYREKRYNIISKSGGFGSADLLLDLKKIIGQKTSKEELVC